MRQCAVQPAHRALALKTVRSVARTGGHSALAQYARKRGGLKAAKRRYWLMYQSAVWFIHQNSLPL
jgi:hypothetical protein